MGVIDYTSGFWLTNSSDNGAVFDGDPYESIIFGACEFCSKYSGRVGYAPTCPLYQKGVPPEIWTRKISCKDFEIRPLNTD